MNYIVFIIFICAMSDASDQKKRPLHLKNQPEQEVVRSMLRSYSTLLKDNNTTALNEYADDLTRMSLPKEAQLHSDSSNDEESKAFVVLRTLGLYPYRYFLPLTLKSVKNNEPKYIEVTSFKQANGQCVEKRYRLYNMGGIHIYAQVFTDTSTKVLVATPFVKPWPTENPPKEPHLQPAALLASLKTMLN